MPAEEVCGAVGVPVYSNRVEIRALAIGFVPKQLWQTRFYGARFVHRNLRVIIKQPVISNEEKL